MELFESTLTTTFRISNSVLCALDSETAMKLRNLLQGNLLSVLDRNTSEERSTVIA